MSAETVSREIKEVASILSFLTEKGVDFVVVGGAAIALLLGEKAVNADLDIVAFEPDPVLDEDFYYDLARDLGCELERNALGGPRLIFEDGFWIDIFSPSMSFEAPIAVFDYHEKYRLPDGKAVKVASLEASLVLKAQAIAWETADEGALELYVGKIGRRLNESKLERVLELYEEGQRKTIERLLRKYL